MGAAVALAAGFRARAADAAARRDADAIEAARLEESAGAELLDDDDPAAADRLATRLATLRASVDMQGRLLVEATARAVAAEAAALRAEADQLAPEIAEATAKVAAFDAKTQELSAALAKHVGGRVQVVMPIEEALDALWRGSSGAIEVPMSPKDRLANPLLRLQVRRDLARGLADVVAGDRTLPEVRAEWVAAAQTDRRVNDIDKAEHLPALVRDGVIVVPGLEYWLELPAEAPDGVSVN